MNDYNSIIFDLDGTIFKTDTVFIEALRQVCLDRKISVYKDKNITKLIGKPMSEVCRLIFGEYLDDSEVEYIRNEVRNIENRIITQTGILYEGIGEVLEKLKSDGYRLCICSNGSLQYIDNVLTTFGIKDKFTIIKSRVEGFSKSQLIKQILDESEYCSAIVVGDTHIDFEAADDTGCLSIGVSYGYGCNCINKADFIASYPSDIYNIIVRINGIYKDIAEQLIDKKIKAKPLIVGVNGVDTSGKTTLTMEFGKYLSKSGFNVQIVHLDDFHNPSSLRNKESDPIISYFNNAFDLKYLEKEILVPISTKSLLDKELVLLDLQKDQYSSKKRYVVDKDTIVFVEGVLLYREPIDKYFDFKIYVDVSFEEVLKRALKRDNEIFGDSVIERYHKKYIPIQERYIENYSPKQKSNVIIDNEDFSNPKLLKREAINKLRIDRIRLISVEDRHVNEINSMNVDSITQEMQGVVSLADIDYYMDKNNRCYAIQGENGEFIGIVELFNISWKNRRAEFSITISPSYREKGYGYDATINMLDLGFNHFGLNRIWLRVLEHNSKAIRLYERAGFIREGICREESLRKGKFINQIQMSILRKEWVHQLDH